MRSVGALYILRQTGYGINFDAQFGGPGSGGNPRITSTNLNLDIYTNSTTGNGTVAIYGDLTATGDITAFYSDERLKKGLEPINNALDKIKSLRAVTYYQNELADELIKNKREDKQVGIIAQDLQKVLPEVVKPAPFDTITDKKGNKTSKSGENYLTVQYEKVVPLLIAAIQELNDKVNNLEEQLKNK